MAIRSRVRWLLLSGIVMSAIGASVAVASHSWGNYHWARTANPFTLQLGDNLSLAWDSYVVTASDDWSKSNVLYTKVEAGGTQAKRCRPTAGRVEVCNSTYGNNGWLGLAQIWASGSHITQGVVKLNDTYFKTAKYNTPAWRQFVMCQEIGHTLGLDHQDENFDNAPLGTCMDYTSNPEHPNAHDYEQLELIYSHLDTSSTVAAASSTSPRSGTRPEPPDVDRSAPNEWGQLVRSSNGGRTEVFELDLGRRHTLIRFVIWAD